jgi:dimeric dUTPase (all-alpha-NTP-PPase superfamily)
MHQALLTMLRMQDRMNTRVHPAWIDQGFAWHRALWVECAELVEHHGYKWWKHHEPDFAQVQLEIVDIWHFGMSARFRPGLSPEAIADELADDFNAARDQHCSLLEAAEQLAGIAALQHRFCGVAFAQLLDAAGMDFAELYRQYLGKNVLNFFRQDHGYKDGSYRKQWDGREDNEHLMELLPSIDTNAVDAEQQLYGALAKRYAAAG